MLNVEVTNLLYSDCHSHILIITMPYFTYPHLISKLENPGNTKPIHPSMSEHLLKPLCRASFSLSPSPSLALLWKAKRGGCLEASGGRLCVPIWPDPRSSPPALRRIWATLTQPQHPYQGTAEEPPHCPLLPPRHTNHPGVPFRTPSGRSAQSNVPLYFLSSHMGQQL